MATFVEINGNQYPATISGRMSDRDWDNRESKSITLELSYPEVLELFVDDVSWNIIQDVEVMKEIEGEDGNLISEMVMGQESYDNSEYSMAGDIIDHRNGTVTVKMGKPTAEELLLMFEEALGL